MESKKVELTNDEYELIFSALELYGMNYGYVTPYDKSRKMVRKIDALEFKLSAVFEPQN